MGEMERGRFEVTEHAELAGRGAFIVGNIVDGVIRSGMQVKTRLEPSTLTISGVESLDNVRDRRHWNALVFSEHPTLEFVKRAFPIGSLVDVETQIGRAS